MTKRITKRDNFMALSRLVASSNASNEDKVRLSEFISHEVALLDKKHAKGGKTKNQVANEGIKTNILAVLAESEGMRATEVAKETDISVQKATALLKQMVDAGSVAREQDGKVVTFSVAAE